jgi:hypothetical protein
VSRRRAPVAISLREQRSTGDQQHWKREFYHSFIVSVLPAISRSRNSTRDSPSGTIERPANECLGFKAILDEINRPANRAVSGGRHSGEPANVLEK